MKTPKIHTETDLISRLGCMRRNTIVVNAQWGTIEHIELWMRAAGESVATRNRAKNRPAVRGQ